MLERFGLELVAEWRKAYKMYSIWFFVIIGLLPDLYNLAVENHLVDGLTGNAPAFLARAINLVAFVGAASRLVKQQVLTKEAEEQAAAKAAPAPAPADPVPPAQ